MRLLHSPTSPFARKVVACAIARGIEKQITLVPAVFGSAEVLEHNPLGNLPCLITNDGVALYDSRVICEFLDSVSEAYPMFPEHGPRVRALRLQTLGDGICTALLLRHAEEERPEETARRESIAAQKQKVIRVLAFLEEDVPAVHIDIGTISVACALGFLDLRYPDEAWRAEHPKLAAWYAEIIERPCLAQTAPREG